MFDVKKHLIKVQGNREYLPVAARLVWFREQHPDWRIETRPVVIDCEKQYAIFAATVSDENGNTLATGTKMENVRGFADYIEKAETGSIGRALAVCGFGTQFAPDLDEVTNGRLADSPQPSRSGGNGNGYSNGNGARQVAPNGNGGTQPVQQPQQHTSIDELANLRERAEAALDKMDEAERKIALDDMHKQWKVRDVMVASVQPLNYLLSAIERRTASDTPFGEDGLTAPGDCATCGRGLTKGQQALSERKYGIALCPSCQRERQPAQVSG